MDISPESIDFILKKLQVLNDDYTALSTDVEILKVQMNEILWLARATVAAFIVVFVRQFIKIIKNNKNGK